jgi:pentatricopeptide repeat protein
MAQQSTFDQANEAYREGDFDKAVQVYQDLLDEGWESAEL